MKLASFLTAAGPALGVVQGERIIALGDLVPDPPSDMKALIAAWAALKPVMESALDGAAGRPLSDVELAAPITAPEKIFAIGLNYADHIQETGASTPEHQVWFAKHGNCLTGPKSQVQIPKVSSRIDYEVEMVAVIGRGGRHISKAEAPAAVFGYCVGDDVSVRDWQMKTPQWVLGKSFDTHGPIGPWITTSDEIGDPHRLDIRCYVNEELRQSSNTRHLLFTVWDQIEHLSQAMTLKPGDLIFTGTPGGVGAGFKPPRMLKAGDRVRCEIEALGALENVMVLEA